MGVDSGWAASVPARAGVCSAWRLLLMLLLLLLVILVQGAIPSSSSTTDDTDDWPMTWWPTRDHQNHDHQHQRHHNNHNHTRPHPASSLATPHHHKHYRDQNNHKVRHHHDDRRSRRRRFLPNTNKHVPKFSHTEYSAIVPENLAINSTILQVHATDDDRDLNGLLRFSVSDPDHFAIDDGGVLTNIKPLDYEHTQGEYRLYVYAEDQGLTRSARQEVRVPVLIRVQDTDEPPYFERPQYTFAITESAGSGTYVGTVVARDADLNFDKYILQDVQPPGTFMVESLTGILTVGQNFFANKRTFDFKAVAMDDTSLSSWVPVRVNIIDENTHKPQFNECAALDGISVSENRTEGLEVVMMTATDKDLGINGQVTYHLLNDLETFAIETRTGHGYITTTRMLDRDLEDREFFLTVIAKDGAPPDEALQEACTFKIVVDDINDNPPNFDKPLYEQNIATDHNQETAVLRVTATDIDALQNSEITYSLDNISEDSSYFTIDTNTGIIKLVKTLDESMASVKIFELLARATDKGPIPLSNTVRVKVMVVSSGSLPPTIIYIDPPKPIPENAPLDTTVATICAQSNVPNDEDVFFILVTGNTGDTNADGTFAIKKLQNNNPTCPAGSRGVSIYLAVRNLDYESITQYKLILQVVNKQNARVDKQVLVEIQDVNDIPPLLQPFEGAITENSPPILITTIKAIDKDASPEFRNLVYSFDAPDVADDVRSKFSLSQDGQLRTLVPLDREEKNRYMIPVHVTDGDHSRTSVYWITVKDINDVRPEFNKTTGVYEVLVPEDKAIGKNTGIVLKVDDPDIVNHNDFQIVTNNEMGNFSIDSTTGEVTVATKLDFDAPLKGIRNFTMLVRLSDGANEMAETYITITVTNVNDNPPSFDLSSYTFTVTENIDCNLPFGGVSAKDPDLPPDQDQNIQYYLQENSKTNFSINAKTGQLSIIGCLDREAATRGSMTIYAVAKDDGGEGYDTDPSAVTIIINDQNDNHPFIQSPEHSYTMFMENTDPNTVMPVTIQLSDWDTEEHGCPCELILESSTPPDIAQKFEVKKVAGIFSHFTVKPKVMLDREAQKEYKLPFRTTDNEGVNGVRYLTVEVGDQNDSPMSDGESTIQVYKYLGQFPKMVIGTVYVTDLDDYDVTDKVFEIDPSTSLEVDTYFDVDYNSGEITMMKDTPSDTYLLRVKVKDQFRDEVAIGQVTIKVVDLTEEAVMQSGSFRVEGYSSISLLEQQGAAVMDSSLYEKLKDAIANIHSIAPENVDIFSLRDVGNDVDVRYNCHGSPYFTAARLNGLMLTYLSKLNTDLGVKISRVNLDRCLYENDPNRPCGTISGSSTSCQQTLKPNMTSPLVVEGETVTMVGVDIADEYDCSCGALEPLPSVCYEGYCLNGGKCTADNNTLVCECPSKDYGPRCELLSARFEKGFAWYEPPKVCENSTLFMSFQTEERNGILLYSGPTVTRPWNDYPRDFVYVVLQDWVLKTYMELGTGTVSMSIPLEKNTDRSFDYYITWNQFGVSFEVINCSGNSSAAAADKCKKSVPLMGGNLPNQLLNLAAPLQLGGVAAMASFTRLASSYEWSLTPPSVDPFHGCVLEFRHKDYLYDLNSTDYDKETYKPCNAPTTAKVIMGKQSIVIIVVSLLCLIMLVLLILCLARRNKKTISYPELDGIVKETIGSTDIEGFGEKDMTQYDLKLLRVGPDGYLFNDGETHSYTNPLMHERLQGDADASTLRGDGRRLPDVTDDTLQKREAPLAQMPEGLSIGEFIDDNIKKVDKDPSDFDDVRHYCYEGDEMSIASLSSIGSGGSTDSNETFDYKNDWGHRFEKLNEIYRRISDEEDDSDYEFNVPKQRKRASLPPPVTETTPSQSPADKDKPVTTSRPTEEPTGGQGGERPPPRATTEAFNPRSPFEEVEGEESWC